MAEEKDAAKEVDPVIQRFMDEQGQGHRTRVPLFKKLEEIFGKPIVSFFTSFVYPVAMEDQDVDMLAGILQMMDLSKGAIIVVSSPGGDGLAAERMINVCRTFSKTGTYDVIVPGKAKSAATMFCFGANKIIIGPTSELGPVDPQVRIMEGGVPKYISAHHIVTSYDELFKGAVGEKGNLEPYLQQLGNYNTSVIKAYRSAISLSKSITIQALKSGMMPDKTEDEIGSCMKVFLNPENTQTHGRPIFLKNTKECGLSAEGIDPNSETWMLIYELYIRTNAFVSSIVSKCIESKEHSFAAPPPRSTPQDN
jgi:hypothetical protein